MLTVRVSAEGSVLSDPEWRTQANVSAGCFHQPADLVRNKCKQGTSPVYDSPNRKTSA